MACPCPRGVRLRLPGQNLATLPYAAGVMAPTSSSHRPHREPLFDIDLQTGASMEVFYADRTMETFGSCGAGWFWWSRRRGFSPDGPATGPFATSYAAYRDGMNSRTESIVRPTSRLRERHQNNPQRKIVRFLLPHCFHGQSLWKHRRRQARKMQLLQSDAGAPEEIRTPDPQIRSLVLYPAELRARFSLWHWA